MTRMTPPCRTQNPEPSVLPQLSFPDMQLSLAFVSCLWARILPAWQCVCPGPCIDKGAQGCSVSHVCAGGQAKGFQEVVYSNLCCHPSRDLTDAALAAYIFWSGCLYISHLFH